MNKLRWGILSTARIGNALVRAIRESSNGELVAVASRDLDRAQAWANERGIPRAFGSYEQMLVSNSVDAVYISLPNALHKEWTVRAAERGKHVLCEKPIASNAGEVREMMRAAEVTHVRLMEAFMYRFHPQWGTVRRMIADGAIGQLTLIRATFGFNLTNPNDIRASKELAGGALMDVGCYCVNAARMIAGAEPFAVQASAVWRASHADVIVPVVSQSSSPPRIGDPGVDLSLAGSLEFPDAVLAVVDCSLRTEEHAWVGISGTEGHIGLLSPWKTGGAAAKILYGQAGKTETIDGGRGNEYQLMVEHFGDAVLHGSEPTYPPQQSLSQMQVIDALYDSARRGSRPSPL